MGNPGAAALPLLLLASALAPTAGQPSMAASSTPPTATPPSRPARASHGADTVSGDAGEAPRPALSRAAVMAAARAAVAARAAEAARAAGAAGARLALAAAAPALRAGVGGVGGVGGGAGQLVLGPVDNSSEPRCRNVSSVHYSLDMLLGTWYVVEVLSPVAVGTVCDGFQLTKLNVSRAWQQLRAEAVILSRFGRRPGGPTAYFNRTMLVGGGQREGDGAGAGDDGEQDGQHEDAAAPMLYDQLAVTDYAPGGRFLSLTACRDGQHWTYVYGRRPAPAAPDDLRALLARLAAAGVAVPAAPGADDAENAAPGEARQAQTSTARPRATPQPQPEPPPAFNVTECGW